MLSNTTISVLIRTKNEEKYLGQTLSVLFSQTYKDIEVLIVDSGSSDNTLEIARKYPVTIYEIDPKKFTYGYSLNYGIQRARGKYIACLSAHAMPVNDDWLEILISNFHDDRIAAVMSKTVPMPDCNPFDRRGLTKKFSIPKQEIIEGGTFIYSNACSIISKSAWEKVQFDESLTASEDHDWVRKIRGLNFKVIYEPAAKVYHSHNESLKQIYNRYYREAFSIKVLKMNHYSLLGLLFDLLAGTLYDMTYVIFKRDNIKWFFFAPLRRFVMDYARLKADRDNKT